MSSFLFRGQLFSQNKSSNKGEWQGKMDSIWFHLQSSQMKISPLYLTLRVCCWSSEAKLHNVQPREDKFWPDEVLRMRFVTPSSYV